jgi:hypothetical protein
VGTPSVSRPREASDSGRPLTRYRLRPFSCRMTALFCALLASFRTAPRSRLELAAELRPPPSACGAATENPETTTPPSNRSVGLGVVLECLARLAASGPDRYAGHRGALASARVAAYWRWNSRPRRVGRPALAADLRALIRQMRAANPLWGAPRIHDELQKLGIDVSQATVAKYLGRRAGSPVPLVAHLPHQSRRRARLDRFLTDPPRRSACCLCSWCCFTTDAGSSR